MEWNKSHTKRIIGVVAFAILFYWGMLNIDRVLGALGLAIGLLAPLLAGMCIAFIINVPMRFIESHLFPNKSGSKGGRAMATLRRPASLVLAILFILAVIFVVMFTVLPEMARSIVSLSNAIPGFLMDLQKWSRQFSEVVPVLGEWIASLELDWREIQNSLFGFLRNGAGTLLGTAFSAAASIFSGLLTFFLGLIFAVYILLQKEKLGEQARKILYAFVQEDKAGFTVSVCSLTNRTFSRFLSGQCIEAVILGAMFFIAMTIFRFPYAVMIGVMIGFTALIPVFGAFIGCFFGAFLILMVDPIRALWFLVLFLVLQQLEGNFIYPRVVGNSVGLPAIWVLVAVTVGGSMMGVVGMLVFIPLCSVLYALLRDAVYKRLREKKAAAADPPANTLDEGGLRNT